MNHSHHRHVLGPRRLVRGRRWRLLGGGIACVVAAGCASGESILTAGNDAPSPAATLAPSSASAPAGGTVPIVPTTIRFSDGPTTAAAAPTTVSLMAPESTSPSGPTGFANAPGVTLPLSNDFEPCPVNALDDMGESAAPVPVVFWHAMNAVNEDALIAITEEYNASQDRVVVELRNQTGYNELIEKYFQSSDDDRPDLVQLPEYMTQQMADSDTVVAAGMCIQTMNYDIEPFLDRALLAYQTEGVQWSMPFNISEPVLFYRRDMFEAAGLDPDDPPVSLEDLTEQSQAIVDSGAATYGIAFDTGVDSGGGWFLEQWFARLGLPYSDNNNGRTAPSTQVLFNSPEGVELLTYVQNLVSEGFAVTVGDNPQGIDVLLKLGDPAEPSASGIASSAALGTVLDVVEGGLIEGITTAEIGVGPMPGPGDTPGALVGGASLYLVSGKADVTTAAAWEYVQFLVDAQTQSTWASLTGYTPVREDAIALEPLATTYAEDPRFRVAYDQLLTSADDFSSVGPMLGPLRQIREVTARMMADIFGGADVETALNSAADQANLLIIDYSSRT